MRPTLNAVRNIINGKIIRKEITGTKVLQMLMRSKCSSNCLKNANNDKQLQKPKANF